MLVADEDISMIIEGIFAELLGFQVQRTYIEPVRDGQQRVLTGCVQITGAWEGAVTVDCSTELAERTAAAMFGAEPSSLEEVSDAVGEIANMTGGNVKALLPGPSRLSLPAVAESTHYPMAVPGSSVVTRLAFECQGLPLFVTVLQRDEAAPAEQDQPA